jgi:hypothetical protein
MIGLELAMPWYIGSGNKAINLNLATQLKGLHFRRIGESCWSILFLTIVCSTLFVLISYVKLIGIFVPGFPVSPGRNAPIVMGLLCML